MSVPFPGSFKHPVILELYNSNLQEHITMFNSMILLNDAIDSILRRALPTFMGKLTLLFFSTLAPSSIHNFVEFFNKFLNHFSYNQPYEMTFASFIKFELGILSYFETT